jgi:hypothetical protein
VYVEFPGAEAHIAAISADLLEWLAGSVASDARRYAPIDTGYLSTHIWPSHNNSRVVASGAGMPPNADAPAYVELGTRPHPIPNAFGLGFTVMHPGTEAQPYLRPAAYTKRRIPPSIVRSRASRAPR